MTIAAKGPPRRGSANGPLDVSLLADNQEIHQTQAPNQANIERNPRAVRESKLELLREAIFEAAGFIRLHAEACQINAEAGDNSGLIYSLHRLIIYAREAARTGNEIRAIRDEAASNKEGGQ